jgi:WD40 repeat protein
MATSILVAVAGSIVDSNFAVINFSAPEAPTVALVNSNFPGCVVDCSNNLGNQAVGTLEASSAAAAVGNYKGGEVAIYDLNNLLTSSPPAAPNTLNSGLAGIGALAFDGQSGNNLAVGDANGSSVVLMNVQSGAVVASCSAGGDLLGGIYCLALNGSTAVASGVQGGLVLIDFSNPNAPQVEPIFTAGVITNEQGQQVANYLQGQIAFGFDGATLAVGDASGNVYTYDANGEYMSTYLEVAPNGVTSVAVETGNSAQIAAGSIGSQSVSLIDTSPQSNSSTALIWNGPGPNPGGALRFFGLPYLFASSVSGSTVTLLNTLGWPNGPTLSVAVGVNLAQSEQPTLGATAFNPLGGCLMQLLSSPIMLFKRLARPR